MNHFKHQTELRTLKVPSSQTQTPLWSNLGLQRRVKFSQMLHRKHAELPEPGLFTGPVLSMPVKIKSQLRRAFPAREPLHFLDPKEIVTGIIHWSKEKWNSLWNATKASWWKQSQQRVDIWSIVTEELGGRLDFSCWRVNNTILNGHTHTVRSVFKSYTLHIKLKITISFGAVFDWYLLFYAKQPP